MNDNNCLHHDLLEKKTQKKTNHEKIFDKLVTFDLQKYSNRSFW